MKQLTGKAWVSRQVVHEMSTEASRLYPLETGGLLIGYWISSEQEVVINHATGPGPCAIHHPTRFIPDYNYQQAEIARIYYESAQVNTYLGDWHTHPRGGQHLSYKDRRTLRKIANFPEARARLPIMAILGGGEPNWLLSIWRYSPLHFRKLIIKNSVISMELAIFDE